MGRSASMVWRIVWVWIALWFVVGGEETTCLADVECASVVKLGGSNRVCYELRDGDGAKVGSVCTKVKNKLKVNFFFRAAAGYRMAGGRAGVWRNCGAVPNSSERFQRSATLSAPRQKLTVSIPLGSITSASKGCCGRRFCFVFEAQIVPMGEPEEAPAVLGPMESGRCFENAMGVVVCARTMKCEGCEDRDDGPQPCEITEADCAAQELLLEPDLCECVSICSLADLSCVNGQIVDEETCQCVCDVEDLECPGEATFDSETCACVCPLAARDCVGSQVVDYAACDCVCQLDQEIDCVGEEELDAGQCACVCRLSAEEDCVGEEDVSAFCECYCPLEECPGQAQLDAQQCRCDCELTDQDCLPSSELDSELCICA